MLAEEKKQNSYLLTVWHCYWINGCFAEF